MPLTSIRTFSAASSSSLREVNPASHKAPAVLMPTPGRSVNVLSTDSRLSSVIAVSSVLWIVWLNQGLKRGVFRPDRLVWANTLGFAVGVTLGFALFIGFFFVAQVRPIIEFEEGFLVLIL